MLWRLWCHDHWWMSRSQINTLHWCSVKYNLVLIKHIWYQSCAISCCSTLTYIWPVSREYFLKNCWYTIIISFDRSCKIPHKFMLGTCDDNHDSILALLLIRHKELSFNNILINNKLWWIKLTTWFTEDSLIYMSTLLHQSCELPSTR